MATVIDIRETITRSFLNGELSIHDLSILKNLVQGYEREARRLDGRAVAASLRVGSAVRISPTCNLSPRYILGTNATVVRINKTTATVTLGHVASPNSDSRFFTGQEIRCPLDALELMGEE